MSEIVKVCKIHGKLTEDKIHPKGKSKTGKQYYGCRLCKKEASIKYYESHPDKIKEMHHNQHQKRKNNPEWKNKKNEWQKDYFKRLRGDPERLEKYKERNKREKRLSYSKHKDRLISVQQDMRDNLHKSYVKNYLKVHYGFEDPSDELINTKSILLLLRREIMQINFNRGKNKYVKKTGGYKRTCQNDNSIRRILFGKEEDSKER